ncbi:MAG TPA: YigZ family protein [Anaerolineales bacterium]|nr:YigZ family protein [Anaerolineales bacterium]
MSSRFIGSLAYASSVEDARDYVRTIQGEYPDASHHVPAYIIGHDVTQVTHCSDAGEPSGSAGRPILAVLQGSGLGDVVVVVTRYFGGTKLGIGGLVRAYGDTVRKLIAETKRAWKVSAITMKIEFDYPFVDRVRSLVASNSGQIRSEGFEVKVNMTAILPLETRENFEHGLSDLTSGTAAITKLDAVELLVPIVTGN